MTGWIVAWSMKFRLLVVAIAALTLVVGVAQLRSMSVDVLPEYAPVTVEVQTEALGLSSAEVEQLITVPIEQDLLNGIAFLKDIRSQSVPGMSRILLVFEPGTDLFTARQVVAERMTQAHALPNVSKPPQILQPLSSTNRVLMVGVNSKTLSPIQMSVLARWTIIPRLLGVPGVANVSIWGERARQLQVQVDPAKLSAANVSLQQVIETSGNALWVSPLTYLEASTPGTGGFIDTANQRLGIQHISPITTPQSLGKVTLEGTKMQLGDVATVVEDHPPLIGDALTTQGPGLMFVVEKAPDASTLDVTRKTEAAIKEMQPGLAGVQFNTTVFRPATYIEKGIDNLQTSLIVCAILALLGLAAFLLRWRPVAIILVVVPLSFVAAALVLDVTGATMNAVAFVGLLAALALVIDDAIVTVDSIVRRMREGRAESTASTILRASLDIRSASVYATLVVAVAIVPVYFLEQVPGAFFPEAATSYLLALLAALVVSITVTPALAVLILSRASVGTDGESPLVRLLRRGYGASLPRMIARPLPLLLAAALLLVAGGVSLASMGNSTLPTIKESQVLVRWDAAPGTSLPEMDRLTARAARELRALPGVTQIGGHVGRAVTADQIVGVNSGELWVTIGPDASYGRTLTSIRNVMAGYPGLASHVEAFSTEKVRESLAGTTSNDIDVRLYGEELPLLESTATKLAAKLGAIDGVTRARVARQSAEPTIKVQVDLDRADRFGLKPGDVRRAAATLLSGTLVGSLFEKQRVFDVVVWGTPRTRSDLTSVRNLLIETPTGGHVHLSQVADVAIGPSPPVIERQAVSRLIDISVVTGGRDRGAVTHDINRVLQSTPLPLEYHAEVLGEETQPMGLLISLGIAAIVGMLLLLQVWLGSWRFAALALLTPLVAAGGGLLAARIAGDTLSLGSWFGIFAVLGIAMRNGLLLVSACRRLERDAGELPTYAFVMRGSAERLVPVAMTTLVTGFIALAFILFGARPGQELAYPFAIVVLGGALAGTASTLFAVPALYTRLAGVRVFRGEAIYVDVGELAGRETLEETP
jgi:Cu/Ag efflux pump CusA